MLWEHKHLKSVLCSSKRQETQMFSRMSAFVIAICNYYRCFWYSISKHWLRKYEKLLEFFNIFFCFDLFDYSRLPLITE